MEKIDEKKLKLVAGCFPTGVAVVTHIDKDENLKGITVNSYVSISLDPPLIMFSIQNGASFREYCEIESPLAFSLLSEEQEALSNYFAGFGKSDLEISNTVEGQYSILNNSVAWYKTVVESVIPAGDHHLILCRVLDLDLDQSKNPLVYYKGYKTL